MKLSLEQLNSNYNKLINLISNFISDESRRDKLLSLYKQYESRIKVAPASDVSFYHNTFKGGYVDHVLRVIQFSFENHKMYQKLNFDIDYTEEELFMVALNHDLGKIGDEDGQLYIYNESKWHRENQGKIYRKNGVLDFMEVQDRSLYILQMSGITLTKNEYLGIKLHDGPYAPSNDFYYKTFKQENKLKTLLPYVIHQADLMASIHEYRTWVVNTSNGINDDGEDEKTVIDNETKDKLQAIFNNHTS